MTAELTHDSFAELLEQKVTIRIGELNLPATIVEIKKGNRHGDAANDPFSIIFITESMENHGQGIYTLIHPEFPQLDIFLVPLGPKGKGMSYEAVFT